MNASKDIVLRELSASTRRFILYMSAYASQDNQKNIPEDKWNCVQIIQHVIAVDRSILKLLQKPFLKKKSSHYSKYEIRDLMLNRRHKIISPIQPSFHISSEKSIGEWLVDFQEQRKSVIDLVLNDDFDMEKRDAFPHFHIGNLTKRDWLYVLCFHSDRHIAQMQELLITG